MSPLLDLPILSVSGAGTQTLTTRDVKSEITKPTDPNALVLEAWAEGYMIGSLIIMSCITLANMRRGVLLHKLILLEVCQQPEATRTAGRSGNVCI